MRKPIRKSIALFAEFFAPRGSSGGDRRAHSHAFPTDYRRFTASRLHAMLAAFPHRTVFALGPRLTPAFVFAVAAPAGVADFDECARRFEAAVTRAFAGSRWRGALSELVHRGRFFGLLLGPRRHRCRVLPPGQACGLPRLASGRTGRGRRA